MDQKRFWWRIKFVEKIFLNTAAYHPIRGGSYIKTPVSIEGKHAIINVKNEDDKCFMWAVLSALHPVDVHAERVTNYEQYENELDFTGISFPMSIDDIPKFEKINDIPISVYTIEEKGKQVYPLYYTKRRDQDPISLLLIEGEDKYHYTWIKHFNRLLSYDRNHAKVFCPYCCYGFDKRNKDLEEDFKKHKEVCMENGAQRIEFPEEGKYIKV